MGTVKEKPKKVKSNDNLDKLTKDLDQLKKDLDQLGNWIADVDEDLKQVADIVDRMSKRMGMNE